MNVPIIETERLRLRGHRLDDYAASAALWADPIVTRYITGRASTPEESWSRLHRYVGHWALLDFGYWAVEEKSTGEFIGEVGFADFKRVMEPPLGGAPELGWVLTPRVHGRGYATEAVRAATVWGEGHFEPVRVVCIIDPENLASIRVAEKCGFQKLHETTYKTLPTVVFARS